MDTVVDAVVVVVVDAVVDTIVEAVVVVVVAGRHCVGCYIGNNRYQFWAGSHWQHPLLCQRPYLIKEGYKWG